VGRSLRSHHRAQDVSCALMPMDNPNWGRSAFRAARRGRGCPAGISPLEPK
jgi:hypothetical protein